MGTAITEAMSTSPRCEVSVLPPGMITGAHDLRAVSYCAAEIASPGSSSIGRDAGRTLVCMSRSPRLSL
jgi:hypothetical protein